MAASPLSTTIAVRVIWARRGTASRRTKDTTSEGIVYETYCPFLISILPWASSFLTDGLMLLLGASS